MRFAWAKFLLLLVFLSGFASAQQTMGLLQKDSTSFEGYTLFAPMSYTSTYLIDHCGREVNTWTSNYGPGLGVYLLEDGSLLRTGRLPSPTFQAGGIGGIIQRISWNDSLLWEFRHADTLVHQHHDIEAMPNGNVLILSWEYKSVAGAVAAGRDSASFVNGLWPDYIVEIEPAGPTGGNIVWEWHAWDHLIQDFDSSKAHFGVVGDHPELIDVNFHGGPGGALAASDWLHTNSIQYNPQLDQIILSVRNFNEVWIIDHSTTTAEAASHAGGNSGKGGDLLYRWGNPFAYRRGTPADQELFLQHDAQWIADTLPGAGKIMVFNNGPLRPGGPYSSVDIFTPPLDTSGNYVRAAGQPFGPTTLDWTYVGNPVQTFYSENVSGAQRLPNGNTLICEGASGHLFEIDPLGNTVWNYIAPVGVNGPLNQGDPAFNNNVFRTRRYPEAFPGLQGKDLSPSAPLELNPILLPDCQAASAFHDVAPSSPFQAWPVPFRDAFQLSAPHGTTTGYRIINSKGTTIHAGRIGTEPIRIHTENWSSGVYLVIFADSQFTTLRLVKTE